MNETFLPSGVANLPQLGVIQATGADAAHFLHNQLSQDFLLLSDGQARLAAYCSAKGRMLASFVAWKSAPETILLVTPRSNIATTLQRLRMFVLRAKVKLSDASSEFQIFGLLGNAASAPLGDLAQTPWNKVAPAPDGIQVISMYPALGMPRALWVAPAGTQAPEYAKLTEQMWNWSEICSGVVLLPAALSETLVPQMMNYESVGGVNFKKGCYPGQEVVARSQFRGTLKRRGFILRSPIVFEPGTPVYHNEDHTQPCGLVVAGAAAPPGDEGALLFASLQISATTDGHLHGATADGPVLELCPLPYPLLDDI